MFLVGQMDHAGSLPMPQPEAQPRPQTPRFVAPHFVEIEGSADIPGAIRRACAFTTAAPGWPRCRDGATHYHRCILTSHTGRWKDGAAVGWRTESWPAVIAGGIADTAEKPACLLPPASAPMVAEGHAEDLMQAIASALGAAYAPLPGTLEAHGGGLVQCIAPAFVEMARERGCRASGSAAI
ncbi:hypothetical protein [Teichococcus aestuarii]|uniref:hypothetical protein n=1 Tax=Teichococcus aestuarii TaxID=568898 RepID=UPI0036140FBA